jgi:succinylarginine dihydrolase
VKKSVNNFSSLMNYIEISAGEMTVGEAVKSYFFNSQLLDLGDGKVVIVAPSECAENARVKAVLDSLSGGNGPVSAVHYLDVRESMRNGGGPACLRLRVALNGEESAHLNPGIILGEEKLAALTGWLSRYYRDRLVLQDLRDPLFIGELEEAFSALSELLGMPDLYDL